MIVVATRDFEVYHDVVGELKSRSASFTTVDPGDRFPPETTVVIAGRGDDVTVDAPVVRADPDEPRVAVESALAQRRESSGRTIIGVDPGARPGIAVLDGDTVTAAFHVPLAAAAERIEMEVANETDPVVRLGDGSRRHGAKLLRALTGVPVELVDETGTTPHVGGGVRGLGDVLAAVNIARRQGRVVESLSFEPTDGEIAVVKSASRERSVVNRAIDDALARRVAVGELTLEEALAIHEGQSSS